MRTIKIKELEVPTGAIVEVANILEENKITNELRGGKEDDGVVVVEVHLEKGDEKARQALLQIEDLIDDYESEEDNEEEEDDDDDDND